jgi:hypothetical protein
MNLIEKYSHVLESSDLVSVILNLLWQLHQQISLVYISIVCLYYGDLFRVSHEIPFEGIAIIIDDLYAFRDEFGAIFSQLNAQGIIYLIKSLPADICS